MRQLIFLFFFISLFNIAFCQDKKEIVMTWSHKLSFEKVLIAGDYYRFIQQCTSAIDSMVQGTVKFNRASVGSINE